MDSPEKYATTFNQGPIIDLLSKLLKEETTYIYNVLFLTKKTK